MLLDIAQCALKKIDPFLLVNDFLETFDIGSYRNMYVIGTGKGAARMAKAVEEYFGNNIKDGLIIIPENEKPPNLASIKYIYATHPYPNNNGMEGAKKILEIANNAEKEDLIISLISGGGSALMCLPVDGISLKEKIDTTSLLITSGANINEINTVRKHISAIKGGFLAQAIYPARCINVVMSDVIGDDLSTIASGPLSPDKTTFTDALNVLEKYNLITKVPTSVLNYLKGNNPETIKSEQGLFEGIKTTILANHKTVANLAKECCNDIDQTAEILFTNCSGETRDKAVELLKLIKEPGKIYIATGETTVTIKGSGMGGRNQEFVLSALNEIEKNLKWKDFTVLAIGTDGVDGICPQKTAGAIGEQKTLKKAKNQELSMMKFLDNNDSYHFFEKTDGLIITGPTGTNLGDLILIERK